MNTTTPHITYVSYSMKTFSDAIEPQFPERDSGWAEKRGARSRVRFLATALATIFIVWGLQLSFPTLKYRIRECMGLDGDEAVSSSLKSFDWDDVSGFQLPGQYWRKIARFSLACASGSAVAVPMARGVLRGYLISFPFLSGLAIDASRDGLDGMNCAA